MYACRKYGEISLSGSGTGRGKTWDIFVQRLPSCLNSTLCNRQRPLRPTTISRALLFAAPGICAHESSPLAMADSGPPSSYACKCLNIRIYPAPAPRPPQEPLERSFTPVYVGEQGINIVRCKTQFMRIPN